jgi:hypothetical protein
MRDEHATAELDRTLKDQARRLRSRVLTPQAIASATLAKRSSLIAAQYGFNDWNTLHAALGNRLRTGKRLTPGARVTGAYLGQPFSARVSWGSRRSHRRRGAIRVSLDLDQAVDVVTFDSFSSFRKRVNRRNR